MRENDFRFGWRARLGRRIVCETLMSRRASGVAAGPRSRAPPCLRPRSPILPCAVASGGILMAPLPLKIILGVFAQAVVFAFVRDQVKVGIFRLLQMT